MKGAGQAPILAPGRFWALRTSTVPLHLRFLSLSFPSCAPTVRRHLPHITLHHGAPKPETLPTPDPSLVMRGSIGRLTTVTLSISLLPQHLTVAASIVVSSPFLLSKLFPRLSLAPNGLLVPRWTAKVLDRDQVPRPG